MFMTFAFDAGRFLDPSRFTIRTTAKRLDKVGDLWDVRRKPGVDLERCLERLTRRIQ